MPEFDQRSRFIILFATLKGKWMPNKAEKPKKSPKQPPEHSHLASTTYWLLLFVSLALILLYLLTTKPVKDTAAEQSIHVLHELLKEVGFAGLVAFILIITIDGFSRKQHEKNVELLTDKLNKNLFEVVFKNKMPKELYEAVQTQLLESKLVRKNYDALYSFTRLGNEKYAAEWIQLDVFHSYTLENINSEDIVDFEIKNTIDIPNVPALQSLCEVKAICVGDKDHSIHDIKQATSIDSENHFLKYSITVNIPAGGSVKIKLRDKRIMRLHDSLAICATHPTIGMTLTVNVPSGGLSIAADSLHAKPLDVKAVPEDGTMFHWHLPGGLLPYQGIYFQWRPCVAEPPKEEQT